MDDLLDDITRIVDYAVEIADKLEAIAVDAEEVAEGGRAHIESLAPQVHGRRAGENAPTDYPERDRVASALQNTVGRLYQFGKTVFRNQSVQARAYASTYTRTRKAVLRAKQTRAKKKEAAK